MSSPRSQQLIVVVGLLVVITLSAGCTEGRAVGSVRAADRLGQTTAPRAAVSTMTSSTDQAELLLRPPGRLRGLVLFMHGFNSDQNQILETPALEPVRVALLAHGYAIVASAAHGNNFGDPVSVHDQVAALDDARARLPQVSDVSILGFSMGGLDALLSASSHELLGLHAVALLSPAVDQTSFLTGPFAPLITAAFGDPPPEQVPDVVRQSDPLAQPGPSYVGYRYHFWHSSDDHTVPSAQSTTMARYLATAGIVAPVSPLTGDHGDLSSLDPEAIVRLFSTAA